MIFLLHMAPLDLEGGCGVSLENKITGRTSVFSCITRGPAAALLPTHSIACHFSIHSPESMHSLLSIS